MDIVNLIRASPKRSAIYPVFKMRMKLTCLRRIHLRQLCPTRWTTRHESISSILQNYTAVLGTLGEVTACDESNAGTKANGLHACRTTSMFYFSFDTGLMTFQRTEVLSKTLQTGSMTVTVAIHLTKLSLTSIQRWRDDSG
jgi:hypothetical protein